MSSLNTFKIYFGNASKTTIFELPNIFILNIYFFMDKVKTKKDVRDLIMNKMNNEGRTLMWLHRTTDISYDTLNSCLKKKLFSLSQENLDKINTALETDFELE